jgi:hypothetical protein
MSVINRLTHGTSNLEFADDPDSYELKFFFFFFL